MKRTLFFVLSLFIGVGAFAQENIVDWKFETKKLPGNKYEVKFTANVQQPWHIYSITQEEGGPTPTKFAFNKNPLIKQEGEMKEVGKMEQHFEKVFDLNTKFYHNKVEFVQVVSVKAGAKTNLAGTIEFMTCTNESCKPTTEIPFNIALK